MAEREEATKPISIARKLDEPPLAEKTDGASTSLGSQSKDVELFMMATELERAGKVSQAIKLYERAFRLNPDVDRVASNYDSSSMVAEGQRPHSPTTAAAKPKFRVVVPGLLEDLMSGERGPYEPLGLPEDICIHILSWVGCLHAVSLEECARTCRRMYVASRSSSIWRRMYLESRVSKAAGSSPLPSSSLPTYRHLYFGLPRIRTDGLYICKISYFRPGITDGAFFQPIHLVTYYRYLRCFGAEHDYAAMLVVSTEEPKRMIAALRHPVELLANRIPWGARAIDLVPTAARNRPAATAAKDSQFRRANVFIGKYWRGDGGSPCYALTLHDPQSAHNTFFEMEVSVSRRNNVITCDRYASLSPPTIAGGAPNRYDFDTRDWGKFVFSRVRSYIS